jgi:hypothetical protein
MSGPGIEPGAGLGFCAKAGKGDSPIAAVTALLRKPRRVVLVNGPSSCAGRRPTGMPVYVMDSESPEDDPGSPSLPVAIAGRLALP